MIWAQWLTTATEGRPALPCTLHLFSRGVPGSRERRPAKDQRLSDAALNASEHAVLHSSNIANTFLRPWLVGVVRGRVDLSKLGLL